MKIERMWAVVSKKRRRIVRNISGRPMIFTKRKHARTYARNNEDRRVERVLVM